MSHVGSANICLVNSVPEAEVCALCARPRAPGYLVWFFRVEARPQSGDPMRLVNSW